ncbi:MAG: hypothetical protein VXA09_00560, partial [Burkholderiaceae bacterium]
MDALKQCITCNIKKPFKEFYKHPQMKDGFNSYCIVCHKIKRKKRYSTLQGYLRELYRYAKKRCRDRQHHTFNLTYEEFMDRFTDQYNAFGLTCPITGETMTHVTGAGNKWNDKNRFNISLDRIDNDIGYRYDNIMFVTKDFNNRKHAIRFGEIIALNVWLKELMPHRFYGYTKAYDEQLYEAVQR